MIHEKNTKILHKDLSYLIQGCCFEIRKEYGASQKESVYVNLLKEYLEMKGLLVEKEKSIKIHSSKTGKLVGSYRPDLVINRKIIIEVKSSSFATKVDEKQLYYYLRNSEYELGYLVNFGTPKLFLKRIIYSNNKKPYLKSLLYAFVLFFVWFSVAKAATLYAGSAYQTIEQDQTFVIDWFLDTENQEINGVVLKLNFTKDTLEAVEAGIGQSLLSLWIKNPTFSNDQGTVEFLGGAAGGLRGEKIPIFRTIFRAKAPGSARITMDASSVVLLNDGKGTPDKLVFKVLNFIVGPKGMLPITINSPTHPDPNSWYRKNRVIIKFIPRAGEDYSYSFSSNLEIFPDDQKDQILSELIYENLPDGIYYFKLNSRIDSSNWQEAGIFRVQIDFTPPEELHPQIASNPLIFAGQPFLSFSTVDKTSGISHYKVKVGVMGRLVEARSPFLLSRPILGNTTEIQAVDRAGNVRKVAISYPGLISWQMLIGVMVLIIAGLSLLLFRKQIGKLKAP